MSCSVVYRYFHPGNSDHFYTTNASEIGTTHPGETGTHGYKSEGSGFAVYSKPAPGLVAVYRYYNGAKHDHFYTADITEIGAVMPGIVGYHNYTCEGTLGYLNPNEFPGGVPVYRYYKEDTHDHLYTTNGSEIGTVGVGIVGNHGYKCEGILGYARDHAGEINLRIVTVNDVYLLDRLPNLATLIEEARKGCDKLLVTLPGDFLGPSLLSSVDGGDGMVKALNACGVTHVCFGNHETDVTQSALLARIHQFNGVWLNTNMPKFEKKLPEVDFQEVTSADGSQTRKTALLGLCVGDPNMYTASNFGGAGKFMTNVNATAFEWYDRLKDKVDAVLPLTHQDLPDDRILAQKGCFPVILAGHDHEEFYESYDGRLVIKAGMDAKKAAIIDLRWPNKDTKSPIVTYKVEDVSKYAPNPTLAAQVKKSLSVLEVLKISTLYRKEANDPVISSADCLLKPTTLGTLISNGMRDILHADAAFAHGGGIRTRAAFPEGLTFADVLKIMPYNNNITTIPIKGHTLVDVLKFTRKNQGVEEYGYFLQNDDGVIVDEHHNITHIGGKPIKLDHTYTVAFAIRFIVCDESMAGWLKEHSKPSEEQARPEQTIFLAYLSKLLWKRLPPFEVIDKDKSGYLDVKEVQDAYESVFPVDRSNEGALAAVHLTVKTLIEAMDQDGNNQISKEEYLGLFGGC